MNNLHNIERLRIVKLMKSEKQFSDKEINILTNDILIQDPTARKTDQHIKNEMLNPRLFTTVGTLVNNQKSD